MLWLLSIHEGKFRDYILK